MEYDLALDRARAVFLTDVVAGLSRSPKAIPCKYFYDARGSELFEQITRLEEYYLTRAEEAILRRHAPALARLIGPEAVLIEFGSGSSAKTRILLDRLREPAGYVPVDISEEHLLRAASQLRQDYPHLEIIPLPADYTEDFELPPLPRHRRKVIFFPGSTIGNFSPDEARQFLRRKRRLIGPDGALLIGVDVPKDPATLLRAYDDAEGVTAAFNRNLLVRIRSELDGELDPEAFEHRAVWNPEASRMEIYLVAREAQAITVAGHRFDFGAGEAIHTENSYKYPPEAFSRLARAAGLEAHTCYTDDEGRFTVHYLDVA